MAGVDGDGMAGVDGDGMAGVDGDGDGKSDDGFGDAASEAEPPLASFATCSTTSLILVSSTRTPLCAPSPGSSTHPSMKLLNDFFS